MPSSFASLLSPAAAPLTAGAAGTLAGAGLLAALALWTALAFNRLVRRRNLVKEAWSGIDVQLKRRHDLVPNLVEAVGAYAGHERRVLEEVTRLRAEAQAEQRLEALQGRENALSGRLGRLLALAEAYPELEASERFGDLQRQLVEVEDDLQMARRYYNGAARDLNIAVESFPSNLVAAAFAFRTTEFFQVEPAVRRGPRVRAGNGGLQVEE